MILIASRKGKKTVKNSMLGMLLTSSVIILTYNFYYLNSNILVGLNLFMFLIATALYFKYKIYKV